MPTSTDVRAIPLDLMYATIEQSRRLSGEACARCGGTSGLRPGGMAYTVTGPDGQGRLAWPVRVCAEHAGTGGTW
ncbi:hypothetical protein [Streptomyces sp. NPDC046976]|uniref:hypothetical protein n=1 Tax=Streptomyces sp. NPDC046976 TaxID=3155258 RepID=UPI0034099161